MLRGFLVVGGVLLLAALASPPEAAKADTRIGVTIGGGWAPTQYYPDDANDDDDDSDYITCNEGRQILRDDGFRRVRAVRCGGEIYRYEALRRYEVWSVRVSARSGRIVSARVIGNYY